MMLLRFKFQFTEIKTACGIAGSVVDYAPQIEICGGKHE